ncbi:MAG: hypothetical protein JSV21_06905 [Nitrospirota bacterium]|nr:MAG: hypothetical protein JSV21_06905 [Nitrospirota bacterium]
MVAVFHIYGLAFFVLGLAIAITPKKHSKFLLAENVWLIAAFGILHGLNEWVDMFLIIGDPFDEVHLKVIRSILMPVSFVCLVVFGLKSIPSIRGRSAWLASLPLILIWGIMLVATDFSALMADIWGRYLLATPGILLTSYALFAQDKIVRQIIVSDRLWHIKTAAYAFLIYGFLSGVVVPEADFFPASHINYNSFMSTLDVPVQAFRALCAVVILYAMIKTLRIFEWETTEALKRSRDELEAAVEERTRSLKKAIDEVKVLSGMLPICSSCKKIRDDSGYWTQIESYVREHSEAEFSHGLCPDCAKILYPDIDIEKKLGQSEEHKE